MFPPRYDRVTFDKPSLPAQPAVLTHQPKGRSGRGLTAGGKPSIPGRSWARAAPSGAWTSTGGAGQREAGRGSSVSLRWEVRNRCQHAARRVPKSQGSPGVGPGLLCSTCFGHPLTQFPLMSCSCSHRDFVAIRRELLQEQPHQGCFHCPQHPHSLFKNLNRIWK